MDKYEKYILSFFTSILTGSLVVLFTSDKAPDILDWVLVVVSACGIATIFYVNNKKEKDNNQKPNTQKQIKRIIFEYE